MTPGREKGIHIEFIYISFAKTISPTKYTPVDLERLQSIFTSEMCMKQQAEFFRSFKPTQCNQIQKNTIQVYSGRL